MENGSNFVNVQFSSLDTVWELKLLECENKNVLKQPRIGLKYEYTIDINSLT